VTDWLAYDTGYTERYLGVPPVDLKVWLVAGTGQFSLSSHKSY